MRPSVCRPHPCSRRHDALVADFRAAVWAWEIACGTYIAGGGAAEQAEYERMHPRPLFRDWLLGQRDLVSA